MTDRKHSTFGLGKTAPDMNYEVRITFLIPRPFPRRSRASEDTKARGLPQAMAAHSLQAVSTSDPHRSAARQLFTYPASTRSQEEFGGALIGLVDPRAGDICTVA